MVAHGMESTHTKEGFLVDNRLCSVLPSFPVSVINSINVNKYFMGTVLNEECLYSMYNQFYIIKA